MNFSELKARRGGVSILVMMLFLGTAILYVGSVNGLTSSAQAAAQGFQVISAHWGNSTVSAEGGPGEQDVPLTITLQYLYPYSALYAQLDILLPSGFTTASSPLTVQSGNNDTIYYPNSLQKGQVFQVETFLNLADNVSLGTYTFPTAILWNAVLSNSTAQPEVSLEQNTNIAVSVRGNTVLSYSTSQSALTPGQVNNVTLTLDNSGSGNASAIKTTLSSSNSQQISVLNQFPSVANLASQQSTSSSIELFVSSSAAGSSTSLTIMTTYLDAYGNLQSTTQTLGMFVSTTALTSQLVIKSNTNSLTPGQVNNITLVAINEGSFVLSSIATQVSSSSQSVSVLTQPDVIHSLSPGSSTDLGIGLFVSATASNTPVTLSVTSTFTVLGPNETGTTSQNVGLYVSSMSGSAGNSSLSVSIIKNDLLTGVPSQASFNVTNTGSSAIYDPTFALTVSSPLVTLSNSSYSLNGGEILAGGSVVYEAMISSSPSATIGVYEGSLTVTYSNQYGISNSQTVQVGFILTGTIDLIIQDETVTQSSGNLTVSGSLLNEGTASAYYASVVGFTNSTSSHPSGPLTYIGEIDPNTPVPFSTTIPYTLRAERENLNVVLNLTYKDSFGTSLLSTFNTTATVVASSATTTTSVPTTSSADYELVQIALYASIVVVIIAAIIGVTVVRRKRRQMRIESGQEQEESKVV